VLFIGDKGTGKSTLMKAFLEHWNQKGYVPEESRATFDAMLKEVPGGTHGGEGTMGFIHYGQKGATTGSDIATNDLDTNYFSFCAPERKGQEFAQVTLTDSRGFHVEKDSYEKSKNAIYKHIQQRSIESANEDVGSASDTRVHIIIYLLIPHRVKPFDIDFITALQRDSILEYGNTIETASTLTPVPRSDDHPWWLLEPRGATVIPVIGKADSMTIIEKWQCQYELGKMLHARENFKWVNLRKQFSHSWRSGREPSKVEDNRQVALVKLAKNLGWHDVPLPKNEDHESVARDFDGIDGAPLNIPHIFNAKAGEYYKAYCTIAAPTSQDGVAKRVYPFGCANATDRTHSDLPALAEDLLSNAGNRTHLFEVARRGTLHFDKHSVQLRSARDRKWLPRIFCLTAVLAAILGGALFKTVNESFTPDAWPPSGSAVYQYARGYTLIVPPFAESSTESTLAKPPVLNVVSVSKFVRISFLLPGCDRSSGGFQLRNLPDDNDGIVYWENSTVSTATDSNDSTNMLLEVAPTNVFYNNDVLYVALARDIVRLSFSFCRRPATVVVRRMDTPENDLIGTRDKSVQMNLDASGQTTTFEIPFPLWIQQAAKARGAAYTVDARIVVDNGAIDVLAASGRNDANHSAGNQTVLKQYVEFNDVPIEELSKQWADIRYTATQQDRYATLQYTIVVFRQSDDGDRRPTLDLSDKLQMVITLPKTNLEKCQEDVKGVEKKMATVQAEATACAAREHARKDSIPSQVEKCEADCRVDKTVLEREKERLVAESTSCRTDITSLRSRFRQVTKSWKELASKVLEGKLWHRDLVAVVKKCAASMPFL